MELFNRPGGSRSAIFGALAIVYVVWGATYAFNRISLTTIPPFAMSGARFAISGIVLITLLKLFGSPPIPARRVWAAVVTGFVLIGGGNGLIVAAQSLGISSSLAALGAAASPIWVAVITAVLGRPPTVREWVGIAVGFAGIIVLNHHAIGASLAGMALLMGGSITWGIGSVMIVRTPQPTGAMAPAIQMLAGGLLMLSVSAVLHERLRMPSEASAAALAANVLLASILAFIAYNYLLSTVRPALATSAAFVNPVIATFIGALAFREKIGVYDYAALALIIGGVVLVATGPRPEMPTPASDAAAPSEAAGIGQ